MTTLDFELEIGLGSVGTYPVVARALGEEVTTSIRLPMILTGLDQQITAVRRAVLASAAVVCRTPTIDERPPRELGQQLFEALISGDVQVLHSASKQRAHEQGSMLRLVLRVRPPELAQLPWEFLFDPDQQDYLGLCTSLVRYAEVMAPLQPLQVALPLRILGMVACPGDQSASVVDREQQRLRTALADLEHEGLVELFWVTGQTYNALENFLDQGPWHVFHFVGHGGDDQLTGDGALALADDEGRADLVGVDNLGQLFVRHPTLRLIVLDGCHAGRGGALDTLTSSAGALARRRIPAVVAMQFEITNSAAIMFAGKFYRGMIEGRLAEDSVMLARQALRRAKKDTLEWGVPVLYSNSLDEPIFDIISPSSFQSYPSQDLIGPQGLNSVYVQGLAAFWTEQWDRAVPLLQQVHTHRPHHDLAVKLEQARHPQRLATRYAQACAAADALDWDKAIKMFMAIIEIDPTYRDVGQRLDHAQRRRQLTSWQAEARQLSQAREWEAVVKIGERLHIVDPAAADPDGLVSSARERLGHSYQDSTDSLAQALWELPDSIASSPRSSTYRPKVVRFWRHPKAVNAVAFSPDGSRLATAGADKNVRIWDVTSGQLFLNVTHKGVRANARGRSTNVLGRTVAFSPNGHRLATASDDHTARIWDTASGQQLATLSHDNVVVGVAFSPNGHQLATASNDHTARIWDTASGQQLATLSHHRGVMGVAFSPNGHQLATASNDHTARIWMFSDDE